VELDSFQLDARFVRPFAFGRTRLDFSAEAFNLTNHANWSGYAGNQKSPITFGRPTTPGVGRQIQLGAHLKFRADRFQGIRYHFPFTYFAISSCVANHTPGFDFMYVTSRSSMVNAERVVVISIADLTSGQ
jgi:hypothetical protein